MSTGHFLLPFLSFHSVPQDSVLHLAGVPPAPTSFSKKRKRKVIFYILTAPTPSPQTRHFLKRLGGRAPVEGGRSGGIAIPPEGEFPKRTKVLLGESLPTFCSPPAVGHSSGQVRGSGDRSPRVSFPCDLLPTDHLRWGICSQLAGICNLVRHVLFLQESCFPQSKIPVGKQNKVFWPTFFSKKVGARPA